MKIRKKLLIGHLTIVAVTIAVACSCLLKLKKVADPLNKDIPQTTLELKKASHLDGLAQFIRYYDEVLTQSARNYAFTRDRRWEIRYRDVEPKLDLLIKKAIQRGDEKDKQIFKSIDKANLLLVDMEYRSIELVNNNRAKEAVEILESEEYWNQKAIYEQGLKDYVRRRGAKYDDAVIASTQAVEMATSHAQIIIKESILFILIFLVASLALAVVISLLVSLSISSPIEKLKAAAARIGAGDFKTQIDITSNDEIAELAGSMINMANHLEESNRQLQDFVYIASHDLREPLRKISAFGSLLKISLEGRLTKDNQENLDFMVDGADRMTEMIEALLAYSRIKADDTRLETVDLNKIITQLEQLELAITLEETRGTIEVPRTLPKTKANPVQIRQLLQNLIANGIKYHRNSIPPRIAITAKDIEPNKIRLEIRDNGIGIKKEYYDRIFEMFCRLPSIRKNQGTGIGLALCKKVVQRHGGQIGVESTFGKGSKFWFILPSAEQTFTSKQPLETNTVRT